jgi:hypothetical protein
VHSKVAAAMSPHACAITTLLATFCFVVIQGIIESSKICFAVCLLAVISRQLSNLKKFKIAISMKNILRLLTLLLLALPYCWSYSHDIDHATHPGDEDHHGLHFMT